jgi:hypothetical protein
MWANIPELGVVDGPTEVHKIAGGQSSAETLFTA